MTDGSRLRLLHYETPGADSSCLFIHGFGEGAFVWDGTCRSLHDTCTSVCPDLRGHGDSDAAQRGSYSLEGYVDDTREVLARLRLGPCVVVGHSLGGKVAIVLAARYPEHVSGLVIVDSCPQPSADGVRYITRQLERSMQRYESPETFEAMLAASRPFVPAHTRRFLAEQALRRDGDDYVLKLDPTLLAKPPSVVSSDTQAKLQGYLPHIRCPTLIVRGEASAIVTREAAERLRTDIAHSRLVTIPRAGHAVMIDNAGGFTHALRAFLRERSPTTSRPAS